MLFHCVALMPHAREAAAHHATTRSMLDCLALADSLGFDGICIAGHPRPPAVSAAAHWAMAGALTQRSQHARISVIANADSGATPRAIAEEFAVLDNLAAGRLAAGFRAASGAHCHALGLNPSLALAQMVETCDLAVRCWTERKPFHHEGACHRARYVNIFPRTFQRPHPPVWIFSEAHGRVADWAARQGHGLCLTGEPYPRIRQQLRAFLNAAGRRTAEPERRTGWMVPVYVGEDGAALEAAGPNLAHLIGAGEMSPRWQFPPGLLDSEAAKLFLQQDIAVTADPRRAIELGLALVGSPQTIRRLLLQADAELALGEFYAALRFGEMAEDAARQNICRFAREVMDPLRERFAHFKRLRHAHAVAGGV